MPSTLSSTLSILYFLYFFMSIFFTQHRYLPTSPLVVCRRVSGEKNFYGRGNIK